MRTDSRRHQSGSRLCWLLCCCFAMPVMAEIVSGEDNGVDADWYQIEVLVFRQLYPADDELYQGQPPVAFPQPIQQLLPSPKQQAALAMNEEAPSGTALDPPGLELQQEELSAADSGVPLPEAFRRLDAADQLRGDTAARLRRSRGYRVLLHEAWRQPMPERAEPSRVLLTGGDMRGRHFELEGYLEIGRARYLHLGVTLWLNEFAPAADWSEQTVRLPDLPPPPQHEQQAGFMTLVGPGDDLAGADESSSSGSVVTLGDDGVPVFGDPAGGTDGYVAVRSWLLQQTRRMRSGEIHYLDHPRFGAIVYAEPWSPNAEDSE